MKIDTETGFLEKNANELRVVTTAVGVLAGRPAE
jgi:hypothetical protein